MHKKDHEMAAAQDTRRKSEDGLWETVKVIIQALLIAFVVRTFLYQPFNIPSASMYPTLKVGDYLFVSKLSYGYGRYSFNFSLGLFGHEIVSCCNLDFPGRIVLADDPKRGDVAVFKLPTDTNIDYIKRVIGLPGDRIQVRDGVLYINGQAVKKERIEDFVDPSEPGLQAPVPQYLETLPNGVQYRVLDTEPEGDADNTDEYIVPPGHYFMMGDNRDNSQDSRYPRVGYVPLENFVGRADIIFFSVSPDASLFQVWEWPFAIRWNRFFTLI
ncbi:MAG: signal peptidase I [Aestuariivirga sp.]|uniref:signal peptidase I n=1 Tax=Aestuariivirga sp. TaxID=2650926 RepID=UPI00301B4D64